MMKRRSFLHGAAAVGAVAMLPRARRAEAAANLKPIYEQVEKRHEEEAARKEHVRRVVDVNRVVERTR
jgi:ribulose kinase